MFGDLNFVSDKASPKVSVHMVAYNHELFIERAVESVLMQKVDFPYELVIGEDCSTDRTREIILELEQKHPDRIRLVLAERNLGMGANFVRTLKACKGKYVALLEGDDYWTSPFKLQRQVDFLDAHPECSACFHPAVIVFEGEKKKPQLCPARPVKGFFSLEDILVSNFMPTCSVMFRNGRVGELPDWFDWVKPLDWALHILNAREGKIGFINERMAVYRRHTGGIWSRTKVVQRIQETTRMLDKINAHLGFRYDKTIRGTISACHFGLALEYAREGNATQARKYAKTCTTEHRPRGRLFIALLVVLWLVVLFPRLHRLVVSARKILAAARQRI